MKKYQPYCMRQTFIENAPPYCGPRFVAPAMEPEDEIKVNEAEWSPAKREAQEVSGSKQ
jgi:hypothetical protein